MSTTVETDEEKYTITPYGLLGRVIDDDSAKAAVDTLTLYMLRQAKPGHVMGIVESFECEAEATGRTLRETVEHFLETP